MKTIETWFYVGLLAVILIFGVGMYYEGAISHASPSTSTQSSTNEYNITLVITNQNYLASAGQNQPLAPVPQPTSHCQLYTPDAGVWK